MVKIVAYKKALHDTKRESATLYVEDLAELARVLSGHGADDLRDRLAKAQLIHFCQLSGITGN